MPGDRLQEQRKRHIEKMIQRANPEEAVQHVDMQQQIQTVQQEELPPAVAGMETHAEIVNPAPVAQERRETCAERKKREEWESAREAADVQLAKALSREDLLQEQREIMAQSETMTAAQIRAEAALLTEKIKASKLKEKARLLEAGDGATEIEKKEILLEGEMERARMAGDFARMLPIGSRERRKAMEVKEQQEIRAHRLKKELSVARIENTEERKREEATLARHARYDALKKIFRKENPLSHEDAVWRHPVNGHSLVNVGRAFFGGTKPMYIFEDRESPIERDGQVVGYKQYLFKEAVTCIGYYKPEGALVTEAAAKLQDRLCGPYSIPAFAAVQEDGRVLGSFQEKVETVAEEQRVDLFRWQTERTDTIPPAMKEEILREHTLDWLLCNFDTKGENFLHRTDNHLCSFDKEASFSKLKEEGAAHMSTTYKPHANDTLYNTMFKEFAEGNITLDLSTIYKQIRKVEKMGDKAYLRMFDRMLTQQYGRASEKNTDRAKIEEKILERKRDLREEYRRFLSGLIHRRNLRIQDCNGLLDGNGNFVFKDERPSIPFLDHGIQNEEAVLVHGLTREQLVVGGATTYEMKLTEQEARQMKQEANGFLTYRQNEDGSCTMRPSVPETVVFDGQEVAFRRNYKRFTRAVASLAVTSEGELKRDTYSIVNDISIAVALQSDGEREDMNRIFREKLLPVFEQDEQLRGMQTAEEAMEELLRFLRLARGYNPKLDSRSYNKFSVLNAEALGSIVVLGGMKARLEETPEQIRERIRKARQNDPSITEEMEEKMLTEDLAAFRQEHEAGMKMLGRCASQDMDSDEVFLPGACSANAQLVSCVMNAGKAGVNSLAAEEAEWDAFFHVTEDLLEEIPQEVERRMTTLTGREFRLSQDPKERLAQIQKINANSNYSYHTGAQIGELDGAMLSLETFAAESYQMTGPGFTDKVGIGLFHDTKGFRSFYGKNKDMILTPEQMRRKKFKEILGEGL